ncbi:MAG: copper ion binding protein [Oscillospiraceae bacterium]
MKTQIDINGMSCGHCKMRIENALSNLAGVEKFDVSIEDKHAVVEYNDSVVSLDAIEEAIEALGFDVAY